MSNASTSHPVSAWRAAFEGLVELADLRQQQVRGDEQAHEREDRAQPHTRERFELDVLGADRVGGPVAHVVEETVVPVERVARLGREGEGLQQRERVGRRRACRARRPRRRPTAAAPTTSASDEIISATSCASARSLAPASA